MSHRVDPSRRALLRGQVKRPGAAARPPWVMGEDVLLDGCTRCEACVAACPEGIIIRGDGGFPEVDFRRGGCTFCRACVDACPEPLFSNPDSASPWSHLAVIQQECLAHRGVVCETCRDACETRAIRFDRSERPVSTPIVDPGQCTGCGFCMAVCPVGAISINTGSAAS